LGSGKDKSFDFQLADFSNQYALDRFSVFNALKILEKEGYIFLSEALVNPSRVMILLNKEDLYRFIVANPGYDSFLKIILRSYTGLFSEFTRIDEDELAVRSKLDTIKVSAILKKLHQLNVIHYIPRNRSPQLTFVMQRMDSGNLNISPENYADRKKFAEVRINAIKDYVLSGSRCRSTILLDYFGESNARRCGVCDICLERNKLNLSKLEFDNVVELIKPLIKKEPMTMQEIINSTQTSIHENKIIKVIQWLLDNNKIQTEKNTDKLRWNDHT
jgi:ATP-dependent DNA helicase RecQ